MFSVAPTDTFEKLILFPFKPLGALHLIYPPSNSNAAPPEVSYKDRKGKYMMQTGVTLPKL